MHKKFLHSLGVPQILIDFDLEDAKVSDHIKNQIKKYTSDIEVMLKTGRSMVLNLENGILGSCLAVYVLSSVIDRGYLLSRYIVPEKIADWKADSWNQGESWGELETVDFLVIDRIIFANLDTFKTKTLFELIETRLLNKKATVLVAHEDLRSYLTPRIKDLFNFIGMKYLKEK